MKIRIFKNFFSVISSIKKTVWSAKIYRYYNYYFKQIVFNFIFQLVI